MYGTNRTNTHITLDFWQILTRLLMRPTMCDLHSSCSARETTFLIHIKKHILLWPLLYLTSWIPAVGSIGLNGNLSNWIFGVGHTHPSKTSSCNIRIHLDSASFLNTFIRRTDSFSVGLAATAASGNYSTLLGLFIATN